VGIAVEAPHFPDAEDLGGRECALLRARMEASARHMMESDAPRDAQLRPMQVHCAQGRSPDWSGLTWADVAAPVELSPFRVGLSRELASDLVDASLGFPPSGSATITGVDRAVLAQWVRQLCAGVLAALGRRVAVPSVQVSWRPKEEPEAPRPAARLAVLEFEGVCGRQPGSVLVEFGLPALKRALVRAMTPPGAVLGGPERDDGSAAASPRERLAEELQQVPVCVTATMGSASISVRDLSDLGVGDIVRLGGAGLPTMPPGGQAAHITVNGRELLVGRAGVVDERLAVQIMGGASEAGPPAALSTDAALRQVGAMSHERSAP
jgi:flagellar motor switch/type III secretory pathway protein FliN